ncbi:peptide-binding protein [Aestuariibius sp. HNIBRBA575]|uniref:peptide-binding protein n=1 Tax=Aestuariibius sp. HNIBRBA575 TaxID=3233343 RepID=UPI0034A2AE3E
MIRRFLWAYLVMIAMAAPALVWAQSFPALYDVTGVAADDQLNIRAEPNASAAILGMLGPNLRGVEIITASDDGRWGMINVGEQSGWISLRFMQRWEQGDYALTRRLACHGTEPFWSFDLVQGGQSVMQSMDGIGQIYTTGLMIAARGFTGSHAIQGSDKAGEFTAMVHNRSCSDGMSDQNFGLEIGILTTGSGETEMLSGCCSLLGN